MRTNSLLVAIHDETEMQRQLLHNKIEQLGFSVAFSSSKKEKLYENFKVGKRPEMLLVNADNYWKEALPMVEKINSLYRRTQIIVYICNENKIPADQFIKAGATKVIVSCNIQKLIESLDSICPIHRNDSNNISSAANPFSSLLKNKKNLIILQELAKSKNEYEISKIVDLAPTTVKTYKQRMKIVLQCKTILEVLALAKDYKVI